jgi:hypothetical protein
VALETPVLDLRDYEAALNLSRRDADLNIALADPPVAVLARKTRH